MTPDELKAKLELHLRYLRGEPEGVRLNLAGARLPHFQLCPEGTIIGWKKLQDGLVACLEIGPNIRRTSSLVGRKCRAESALVIGIYDEAGKEVGAGKSLHREEFQYETGAVVVPDYYNDDIRVECASGIHFFITREEAEQYEG